MRKIFFLLLLILSNCKLISQTLETSLLRKYDDSATFSIPLPYVLDIYKGKKHLVYYGTQHSNNPDDSMYLDMEKRFITLKPQFAFNEGGNGWPVFSTKDSAVKLTGDPGFLIYLCHKHNVPVTTLEPTDSLEYDYLLKNFKKKDVLLMYFVRQLDQLQRQKVSNSDFDNDANKFILALKKRGMPLNDKESKLSYFISCYEDFYKTKFNLMSFDPTSYWPIYNKNILNKISRESAYFRDLHVIKVIEESLKKYDRVFVVMGGSHLVVEEPVLKYLFENY